MEPKILIMGRKQNYYEAEINRTHLQKKISQMAGMFKEEELLNSLRIKNSEIPANQLINYGGTIPLKEDEIVGNETIINGLERFFERAVNYAEKHNAHYVLIQDLKLKQQQGNLDIYGLAQLLIE